MRYASFIWSLFLLALWALVYLSLRSRESRKEMLIVSLVTSLFGLTEPLFVPEYWTPLSLFDLAARTGFDIESIIFAFAVSGIAAVLYEWIFRTAHRRMPLSSLHAPRHRHHFWAILSFPIILLTLLLITPLNPIYAVMIALAGGGVATWYCRPDLKKKMLTSGFIFLVLYFLYFLTLIAMFPGYVVRVWNMQAISGILIFGVPLEELLFALSFGFLWSSVYEHVAWKKVTPPAI